MNEKDLEVLMDKIHQVFALKENQGLTYSEQINTIKKILKLELNDVHLKGVQKGIDFSIKLLKGTKKN